MSHIFISYARKDIDFALKIFRALENDNLDSWIDLEDIPKGEDWEQEIYRGIEEADAFLFLISPDSVASEMCNKEIAHAVKNGKRILPIVIRDADLKSIHPEISKRNWIFCRDGRDDFNKAIEETRTTIHTDYEWLKYHTELQVKALKWEQKQDASRLLRGKELREADELLAEVGSQKDPQPTSLQRQYVLEGRQDRDKRRRWTTIGLTIGLAILLILFLFAIGQRNNAASQQATAQAASIFAVAQQATAQAASIFAVAQQATAQTNAEEAQRQAKIAFARQLSARAQSILGTGDPMTAMLLAVESMSMFPSIEAAQVFQNNTLAYPVSRMTHDGMVTSVAFSPDGKYVVSGSDDKTARVWEAATGKEIARMTHDNYVISVAFSSDSKYLVSGSEDHTARVWEVATGTEIARLIHDSSVISVAFSLDGRFVVSDGDDTYIRVWIWRPDDLISDACSRVTRNLTRAEWQQYIGDVLPYQAVCPNLPIEPEVIITPTP